MFTFLNVWWHDATFYNIHTYIHTITFIQYMYPSPFAEASLQLHEGIINHVYVYVSIVAL